MATEFFINLGYDDIYSDFDLVSIDALLADISAKRALEYICKYSSLIHTNNENPDFQVEAIHEWSRNFPVEIKVKIRRVIEHFNTTPHCRFNFINNVSSLLLIEKVLSLNIDLPLIDSLPASEEENLFKAYLFFTSKWTMEYEVKKETLTSYTTLDKVIVMKLPHYEFHEVKDLRIQFIKAAYFFKFCENDDVFKPYLALFLEVKGISKWNEYLYNLVSVYILLLGNGGGDVHSKLKFEECDMDIYSFFSNFCISNEGLQLEKPDFLNLRATPVYKYSENILLFLNFNFLIDKIFQGIMFDFADVLISMGARFNGRLIKKRPTFFGIFGDNFIESGLFFKIMRYVFKNKNYVHYNGDGLKERFGDGVPDYLILDRRKVYIFEFKNTVFSGSVKTLYDIQTVYEELEKKLIVNSNWFGPL